MPDKAKRVREATVERLLKRHRITAAEALERPRPSPSPPGR
jgi:hypothetical protein